MKNRVYPFGYGMVDGEISVLREEASTVRWIFREYIAGASYKSISDLLSGGAVRYHADTPQWNKNMVKRILENRVYTGAGACPRILDDEMFRAAAHARMSKGWAYSMPPAWMKVFKGRFYCARCGAGVVRRTKKAPIIWICTGKGCRKVFGDDRQVLVRLEKLIAMLAHNPGMIDIPPVDLSIEGANLTRMSNELNRMLDSRSCDEAAASAMIRDIAREKYTVSDDGAMAGIGCQLRELFANAQVDGFDPQLFSTAVSKVVLDVDGAVEAVLTNGQAIGPFLL